MCSRSPRKTSRTTSAARRCTLKWRRNGWLPWRTQKCVQCSHSCEHKDGVWTLAKRSHECERGTQKCVRYVAILLMGCLAASGDLARWVQHIPSPSALEAVFFRAVNLPNGAIEIRRPPKETRPELTKLIGGSPTNADLYALRAHEDELQLDFIAAEADWKKASKPLDLADFYDRRIRPKDEIAVLESVGRAPTLASERLTPAAQQQSWKAFE